jgi:hypothetical protein
MDFSIKVACMGEVIVNIGTRDFFSLLLQISGWKAVKSKLLISVYHISSYMLLAFSDESSFRDSR